MQPGQPGLAQRMVGPYLCLLLTYNKSTDVDAWQNRTYLSNTEKVAYSSAVKCLQSTPSKSESFCPGCKSRYDDFVAVHINQTLTIHGTANFLSWHRYFTWSFETALRNECGYQGWQPASRPTTHASKTVSNNRRSTGIGVRVPSTRSTHPTSTAAPTAWAATASTKRTTAPTPSPPA